jgi:hypothetical protein
MILPLIIPDRTQKPQRWRTCLSSYIIHNRPFIIFHSALKTVLAVVTVQLLYVSQIRDYALWPVPNHTNSETVNSITHFNRIPQTRAVTAQSVQRWATGWTIGVLGFDSRWGLGIFLFTIASRTALGPTQPIKWVPGALSLGVKRRGVKLNTHLHLVPRSRMRGAIPPLPNKPSWRGA